MGVLDAPGALDGTDATGVSAPTGGAGIRGWLSGIYNRLNSQATAAKQPALGTAGTASTDVITVQGIASGTAQPISGTVTSNAGTGTRATAGDVAAAASDSGNPVKVGGKYNLTLPTYTDGQRGDLQVGARGGLIVNGGASAGSAQIGGPLVVGGSDGSVVRTMLVYPGVTDAWPNSNAQVITAAEAMSFNGASWDRRRAANLLATVTATASGDTAVVTPTSSKKIRVLGYSIEVTANAATSGGGVVEVILRDSSTALGLGTSVFCPSAAGTAFGPNANTGWRLLGNGKLSAATNNVLNVNLSAALTAGEVRVNVAYTEE